MKRVKSAARTSPKRRRPPADVDEYLGSVPVPARPAFIKLRETVRSAVPRDATETISYRIPAFKQRRIIVWFAAFSNHCSLFPTAAVIDEFKEALQGYTTSKGTIQFSLDKPLPVALIKRIVKARVNQMTSKK